MYFVCKVNAELIQHDTYMYILIRADKWLGRGAVTAQPRTKKIKKDNFFIF